MILFLTSNDFTLSQGTKGQLLTTKLKGGMSLILFYTTDCEFCKEFVPLFRKLPEYFTYGIKFGIINVSNNKNIIQMSKLTVSPISYVPYVVLFVDGKPFVRYDGPRRLQDIITFLKEMESTLSHKQRFMKTNTKTYSVTFGIPKNADDVCYLEFNNAYKN